MEEKANKPSKAATAKKSAAPNTAKASGEAVAKTKAPAKSSKAAVPEKRQDITNGSYEMICQHCGKNSMLEQIDVEGWKEEKHVNCPVCLAPLHQSFSFSLECRPFRHLTEISE